MFCNMTIKQTATVLAFLLLGHAVCPLSSPAQEDGKATTAPAAEINPLRLAGSWLRPDGGYVLKLADIGFGGTLTASYLNPKPINVSRAAWRLEEGLVIVMVEFQDVNYAGSTYTLAYFPDRDILTGYYYQALQGQTYEVAFERMKDGDRPKGGQAK
jgi:hypothetical protein